MALANFHQSTVRESLTRDSGDNAIADDTIDLPNAHPIAALYIRENATDSTANVGLTHDLVEVSLDGTPVLSGLNGNDVRNHTKFVTGRTFAAPAAGTDETIEHVVHFGRFLGDREWFLPTPLFSNPTLRVRSDATNNDGDRTLDVSAVTIRNMGEDALRAANIRKLSLQNTFSPGTDEQVDTDLPTNQFLGGVLFDFADDEFVDGDDIQVGINNFSERPFNTDREAIEAINRQTYGFDDDAPPAETVLLDADLLGQVQAALDVRSGVDDVVLRTVSSGTAGTGTARVIASEYIPVGRL